MEDENEDNMDCFEAAVERILDSVVARNTAGNNYEEVLTKFSHDNINYEAVIVLRVTE
jgi:hypothetical protein